MSLFRAERGLLPRLGSEPARQHGLPDLRPPKDTHVRAKENRL